MVDEYSTLKRVDLAELSKIRCETFLGEIETRSSRQVLVIRFNGNYRSGSAGEPDARFMYAMVQAAFQAWECWAVILDLSELEYEWGDDIDGLWALRPFQWYGEEYPFAMIVGPGSEPALASLYYEDLEQSSLSEAWVFHDFSTSWKYVKDELAKI